LAKGERDAGPGRRKWAATVSNCVPACIKMLILCPAHTHRAETSFHLVNIFIMVGRAATAVLAGYKMPVYERAPNGRDASTIVAPFGKFRAQMPSWARILNNRNAFSVLDTKCGNNLRKIKPK